VVLLRRNWVRELDYRLTKKLWTFAGHLVAVYCAAILLLWTGAMKFNPRDTERVNPLIANGPLISWACRVMSVSLLSIVFSVRLSNPRWSDKRILSPGELGGFP
jgi:uncharacterized membrane protein YkgB